MRRFSQTVLGNQSVCSSLMEGILIVNGTDSLRACHGTIFGRFPV